MTTIVSDLRKGLKVPEELFEKFLQERGWSWHQLARKELPYSFDDIQLGLICGDYVLWCQTFLKEPDTNGPYRFWDYQLTSSRDKGDVIHSDGAEVGKTREIGNKILWKAFTAARSSSLVAAPEQVHLDDIIDYCNEQMFDLSPELGGSLVKHRKHPHHVFIFNNRSRIYFSPAGHDGTGLRGKHVNGYAIMDEAAKAKNPAIWTEFFRAAKPGCVFGIYSVPDGDRGTVFYRLKERAKGNVRNNKDAEIDSFVGDRQFTFYNWKKTDQPSPFWTAERKQFYIDLYGGEDSSGYRRNVLGEDGDPESAVFPWQTYERVLKDIPEYLALKIFVDKDEVHIKGLRCMGTINQGHRSGREEILEEKTVNLSDFDVRGVVKSFFSAQQGVNYIGADLGFSNDPTEIIIRKVIGKVWRTVARLHLKGVTYDMQAEAIDAMDDVAGKATGIGLDEGNAGSAVCHIMLNPESFPGKNYDERLRGFHMSNTFDDMDENGEVIVDKKTEKPKRKTAIELGMDITSKKMQRCEMEHPFDTDYLREFPSLTYKEGTRHRIYSKDNDHVITAENCCTLAMVVPMDGAVDYFSSGARC